MNDFFTEKIRKLFKKIIFSESGSNDRQAEEHTFMMFIQYLEEVEDNGTSFVN